MFSAQKLRRQPSCGCREGAFSVPEVATLDAETSVVDVTAGSAIDGLKILDWRGHSGISLPGCKCRFSGAAAWQPLSEKHPPVSFALWNHRSNLWLPA